MDAPEGAILKPWGWQKQVYAAGEYEMWLGYSKSGTTSTHHHLRHSQSIVILGGEMGVAYDWRDGNGPHIRYLYEGDSWWLPSNCQHLLKFIDDCMFLEIYRKEGEDCPPVTEDTIREAA